ncbi:MAG: phosphoribosylglycinamide formyltransferase [Nanoarchaeota archaeon]
MLNIAVLGSTSGTDLQAVIDGIESGKLKNVKISLIVSNKKDAYILERGKKHGVESIFIDPTGKKREQYDREIDRLLVEANVKLVVLIGYMKLMSAWFVNKWKNKVMNIHPSLLPMFAGGMDKNVHQEILLYGCKVTGCSLIFIDEGADTGPIILQKAAEIIEGETVDSLKDKVQKAEQEIILKGIELYRDDKLKVEGRIVRLK